MDGEGSYLQTSAAYMGQIDSSFPHLFSSANGQATLQDREDARREGRGDRASREFPDLQSGVREGAVRLSECASGNAPGGEDHFEVKRGPVLLTPEKKAPGKLHGAKLGIYAVRKD